MLYDLNFAASFKKGESDPYDTGNSLIENPILSVSDKTVVATEIEDCHVYLAEDQINNDPLTANTLTFASERDTKQDKSIGTHSSFNDGNVNHGHNHTDHMANSTDASQPTVSHRNLNSGTGTLVPKTPHGQNIALCTKTTVTQGQLPPLFFSTVNTGIAIKRRESEMFLTARLYRLGEAAQFKRLRNEPDFLIASRRFRPSDVESGAQFKSTHSKAEEPVDTRKTITKLILKLDCDSGGDRLDSNEMMVTR
ncbi:hypothetical protein T09_1582 [Trichinella sp. T9]|nr:hypothetical protein T09_1582 [Trichinella sp. T9]